MKTAKQCKAKYVIYYVLQFCGVEVVWNNVALEVIKLDSPNLWQLCNFNVTGIFLTRTSGFFSCH